MLGVAKAEFWEQWRSMLVTHITDGGLVLKSEPSQTHKRKLSLRSIIQDGYEAY